MNEVQNFVEFISKNFKSVEERLEALEMGFKKYIAVPSTVEDVLIKNEIIEFEGAKYRKVDREAREGDVVIIREHNGDSNAFQLNKPYKVSKYARMKNDNEDYHGDSYYSVYSSAAGRTPETVDVYELIKQPVQRQSVPCPAATKSNNELRAEIIEKAKDFVERSIGIRGEINLINKSCNVEFIVNDEKRTVVALLKGFRSGKVHHKGIAKCHPNDVFNADIGKAIALCRALGLRAGEYENAVQPDEIVVGHIVQNIHMKGLIGEVTKFDEFNHSYYGGRSFRHTSDDGWMCTSRCKIINDTNAIYGGVE